MSFPRSLEVQFPPEMRRLVPLFAYVSGPGTPEETATKPEHIGQEYLDTADQHFYKATGLEVTDWKRITSDNP